MLINILNSEYANQCPINKKMNEIDRGEGKSNYMKTENIKLNGLIDK
jgi:hypothetical protein